MLFRRLNISRGHHLEIFIHHLLYLATHVGTIGYGMCIICTYDLIVVVAKYATTTYPPHVDIPATVAFIFDTSNLPHIITCAFLHRLHDK